MQVYCLNITSEFCSNRQYNNGVCLFMEGSLCSVQRYNKLRDIEVINQEGLVETKIKSKPH